MKESTRNSGVKRQESSLDRISSLPDGIRAHILSFLPTKDSVATSLLSSRWKSIWRCTCSLHFRHVGDRSRRRTDKNNVKYMRFANFVTRALLVHDVRYLENLSIELCDENMVHDPVAMININNWVATAVARNIKSFKLWGPGYASRFEFPSSIFTCHSLEKLDLSDIVTLSPSSVVQLPLLKILSLKNVGFGCDESVCKLLRGCLSLHTPNVVRRNDDNVTMFTISSLTLKHLSISSTTVDDNAIYSKLEINAPALKYLHLKDCLFGEFSVESLPSLVEASINLDDEMKERFDGHWSSFDNLIAAIYNVKVLSLDPAFWITDDTNANLNSLKMEPIYSSESVMWLLMTQITYQGYLSVSNPTVVEHSGLFPIFLRLTELTLDHCCAYNSLLKLLDSGSTLETLILKRNRHHSVHENWTKPKRVPVCILSRLKVVSINGFYGREDQLAMVDYILQNAGLLGTMRIEAGQMNISKALKLCQEVLNFERKSEKCKIEFS